MSAGKCEVTPDAVSFPCFVNHGWLKGASTPIVVATVAGDFAAVAETMPEEEGTQAGSNQFTANGEHEALANGHTACALPVSLRHPDPASAVLPAS